MCAMVATTHQKLPTDVDANGRMHFGSSCMKVASMRLLFTLNDVLRVSTFSAKLLMDSSFSSYGIVTNVLFFALRCVVLNR